jgi:hypothetical protein
MCISCVIYHAPPLVETSHILHLFFYLLQPVPLYYHYLSFFFHVHFRSIASSSLIYA